MIEENWGSSLLARLMAERAASRSSPPIIELARDPREAIAYATAVLRGDDSIDRATALDQLKTRIDRLTDADSDEALSELAAHLPVLEGIMLRMTLEATTAKNPDHRVSYMKLALSAQASFARTLAWIATVKSQNTDKAKVIHDERD